MKKILIIAFLLPLFARAQVANIQQEGINFESGLSWGQILDKAKAEHKYIFMDCYATWCGPCKWMNQNIFTLTEVGTYFNSHFVNVKVQMDKTNTDNENIKKWYSDASALQKQYVINAYPTYLFFSQDGKAMHRIEGSVKDGSDFIANAANAFDPAKQYYTQYNLKMERYDIHKNDWKSHTRDSLFLLQARDSAMASNDYENFKVIGNAYVNYIKDPWKKDNLKVVYGLTQSTRDKYFPLIVNNIPKVAEILNIGEFHVREKVRSIIAADVIEKIYDTANHPLSANWKKIYYDLKIKYPAFADQVTAELKMDYYKTSNNRSEYEKAMEFYMNKYGIHQGNGFINNRAWDVFSFSNNQLLIKKAIKWMKPVIAQYPDLDWENVDTYANLLYKAGDRKSAIVWEKKAIDIAHDDGQKKEFEANLNKMQKGEKTWKD